MNIIKRIILFIKKTFSKKMKVEKIEEHKNTLEQNKKEDFVQSLKATPVEKEKKIETLICEGNGLGIQEKITS